MTGTRSPKQVLLHDADMVVSVLDYGAITQFWKIGRTDLILGYNDPSNYPTDPYYMGAIVGRVANRIGNARFNLSGTQFQLPANDGPHHLHGGPCGLSKMFWTVQESDERSVRLTYCSSDGEGGYPGRVDFEVTITLDAPRLRYSLKAKTDQTTPISLTQHNYYTLSSGALIDELDLYIPATSYLERDQDGIMTGASKAISNLAIGSNSNRNIGSAQLDDFLLFSPVENTPAATLRGPAGQLTFFSDQPGAQVYTADGLAPPFSPRGGLCIEPSGYPNAVNQPNFPSIWIGPDAPYEQQLEIEFQP